MKKVALFILLLVSLVIIPINCSQKDKDGKEGASITFWVMPNGPYQAHSRWLREKAAQFENKSGIKVVIEILSWENAFNKISTCIVTGEGADIFQIGTTWNASFAATGGLAEIDLDQFGGEKVFISISPATARYKNKYYSIPWFIDTRALLYNKNMFAEAHSTPPTTLEELVSAGKKITAIKGQGSAISIKGNASWDLLHDWAIILWANGGNFLNSSHTESTINNSKALQSIEWYFNLLKEGLANRACAEYSHEQARATFISGNSAMLFANTGDIAFIKKNNPTLDFGVIEPPRGDKKRASFVGGSNLVVLKKSKHRTASLEWAKFLLEKEHLAQYCQKISQMLPATRAAYNDPFFQQDDYKVFSKILSYANTYPALSSWGDIEVCILQEFSNIFSDYIDGAYSPLKAQKSLDRAKKKIDALLAKEK